MAPSLRQVDVIASDWHNRIRSVVLELTKKIPEVGAIAGFIIGSFWPENKIDVFAAIKKDVQNLVKEEIFQYELNLHKSEIDGLKMIIKRYREAKLHEKGHFLNKWITEADKLSIIFRQSSNNHQLIHLDITLATLHLAGLRERLDFGKDLYGEDNTKQWNKDLEDMYETYVVDFFPKIFTKWKEWRKDNVVYKSWVETHPTAIPPFFRRESHATLEDKIGGEMKKYSADITDSTTTFSHICEAHKTRICNDAYSAMAGSMSTTFSFLKILPDNRRNFFKYDKTVFGRMFKGPYSLDLLQNGGDYGFGHPVPSFRCHPQYDDYSPTSGSITNVVVREWNSIDAMQFIYKNREGRVAGNPRGGQRHDIDVSGNLLNGLHMGFSSGILASVQLLYCDGTSSPKYGNRGGWRLSEVSAKGPAGYKMTSWSYKTDAGPSNTQGPSVIQLEYAPLEE
ncbi:hypothetical protein KP509_08G041900 [Ceratopteris richardii]|uniref:Pesticidal crystal protein domain-containing protein n=1 Tax=Ceratopteris richardii TaxID=49495 RepID=A0A8T2UDE5_CERRI|nr:hypothetical protein KP509_08G041900 [Ceratopteris richardii]KAH7431305.1 hypothetical protein KP509_08G041900 [Ceratopteris richardii]